jgi:nucleotide-binding universal stress UspA family protein
MYVEPVARSQSAAHVVEEVMVGASDRDHTPDAIRLRMAEIMRKFDSDNVALKYIHAEHAAPGEVLLTYAEANGIDLIVLESHCRTGVRRLLLGSVAEEMIRRASCPVLVVRRHEEPAGPDEISADQNRLMVPFDFSANALQALRYAYELAVLYDASLDVVHVIDPATHTESYVSEVAEHGKTMDLLVKETRTSLESSPSEFDSRSVRVSYHALVGFPPGEIVGFAHQNGTAMIVVSSHGRTGKKSILLGSVAEHVVRHVSCPVFIARPFGKSLLHHDRA